MAVLSGWLTIEQNFLGLDEPWCHPDQAGVHVLPAPYEHTSRAIQGSDHGPTAVIAAPQQGELYDEGLRCEPYGEWKGVATAAPLDLAGKVDKEAVDAIQSFVAPRSKPGGSPLP